MISIYCNKTMNLNKRSRRQRNINMAQHETTKMPVRLPKRLLSQAIFNNAIHRIFFSAFPPTILLWKVLLDLHFSYNFTQKTVKFIKFMDISVNFPWTGYGWRIVSKFKKNIHSTSTIVFTYKKNIHSTSTIVFTFKKNIHSTSTIVFTFKKNIHSTSTIVFTFKKNIHSTSTIVFTFKKNIHSTSAIVFTFKKNIHPTSAIVFTFKKNTYSTSTIVFTFKKNIHSTSTIGFCSTSSSKICIQGLNPQNPTCSQVTDQTQHGGNHRKKISMFHSGSYSRSTILDITRWDCPPLYTKLVSLLLQVLGETIFVSLNPPHLSMLDLCYDITAKSCLVVFHNIEMGEREWWSLCRK